jgi:hypothetical protein
MDVRNPAAIVGVTLHVEGEIGTFGCKTEFSRRPSVSEGSNPMTIRAKVRRISPSS